MNMAAEDVSPFHGPTETVEASAGMPQVAPVQTPAASSLQTELKNLSLEAAAERHLGSSSGLSFAKLTQTVLRRLSPDKADFVFNSDDNDNMETEVHQLSASILNRPTDAFNFSMLDELENSICFAPNLFETFTLADLTESENILTDVELPDQSRIDRLVTFYFAHSHTLYPILYKDEFLSTLKEVCNNPQSILAQSPLSLFRVWMVLAIGSTAYQSVTLDEESESMLYYNKAMQYFEIAFDYGEMVYDERCLSSRIHNH